MILCLLSPRVHGACWSTGYIASIYASSERCANLLPIAATNRHFDFDARPKEVHSPCPQQLSLKLCLQHRPTPSIISREERTSRYSSVHLLATAAPTSKHCVSPSHLRVILHLTTTGDMLLWSELQRRRRIRAEAQGWPWTEWRDIVSPCTSAPQSITRCHARTGRMPPVAQAYLKTRRLSLLVS